MTLNDIKLAGKDWLREKFTEAQVKENERALNVLLTAAYNEGADSIRRRAVVLMQDTTKMVARMETGED